MYSNDDFSDEVLRKEVIFRGDKVSNIDKWYYRGDEVSRKQGLLGAGPAKSLPLESCVREDEVFQQQSLLVAELA